MRDFLHARIEFKFEDMASPGISLFLPDFLSMLCILGAQSKIRYRVEKLQPSPPRPSDEKAKRGLA